MKILTQNLKSGKTDVLDVPSPTTTSNKISISNTYSLISTGTESSIVNFGKVGWIDKARQQPDKVKDVINVDHFNYWTKDAEPDLSRD